MARATRLVRYDLKGLNAPASVWRLRGFSGEPTSASRSLFVGRQAELDQFNSIANACLGRRSGHVIYVRGEAGIGKTRLVEEMRRFAEAQAFTAHRSLVLDFGVGKGQDPVRAFLWSLLGVSPVSDPEERRRAAERLVAEGIVAPEALVFLYDLLALPQTGEWRALYDAMDNRTRNRGKLALTAALAGYACRDRPILLIVEDLHWADQQVLAHLAAFASAIADGPGLLVMTSRVEGDPLDAAWRAGCRGTPFATRGLSIKTGSRRYADPKHLETENGHGALLPEPDVSLELPSVCVVDVQRLTSKTRCVIIRPGRAVSRREQRRRTVVVPILVIDHLLIFVGKCFEFWTDKSHRSNLFVGDICGPNVVLATCLLPLQGCERLDSGFEASHCPGRYRASQGSPRVIIFPYRAGNSAN